LAEQNLHCRQYFKTIKDCGGFNKLDFGKSKMTVVDMEEEMALEAAKAAEVAAKRETLPPVPPPPPAYISVKAPAGDVVTVVETKANTEAEETEETDLWSDDGNVFGPIAM
jgi:hypothetical protein